MEVSFVTPEQTCVCDVRVGGANVCWEMMRTKGRIVAPRQAVCSQSGGALTKTDRSVCLIPHQLTEGHMSRTGPAGLLTTTSSDDDESRTT